MGIHAGTTTVTSGASMQQPSLLAAAGSAAAAAESAAAAAAEPPSSGASAAAYSSTDFDGHDFELGVSEVVAPGVCVTFPTSEHVTVSGLGDDLEVDAEIRSDDENVSEYRISS